MTRITPSVVARERAQRTTLLTLREAAYFLDVTEAQAARMWTIGLLPRPLLADGTQMACDGRCTGLVPARELRAMLPPSKVPEFDRWQNSDLEIPDRPARRPRSDRAVK